MSRDINKYERDYLDVNNGQSFETILIQYRRKKISEILRGGGYCTDRMLEIGCGMEPFFLTYHNFKKMTVVEPARAFYENAAAQAEDSENITIICDFIENQTERLSKTHFDMILSTVLLHELENPEEHVKCLSELCDSNTHVLLADSNPNSFHILLALQMGLISDVQEISDRQRHFQQGAKLTRRQIGAMLAEQHFEVVETGSYFIKPFTHMQMERMLKEEIITPAVLDGLDKMVQYMPDMGAENYWVLRRAN